MVEIDEDYDSIIDEIYLWSTSVVTGGGSYWLMSKVNVSHDIAFVVALFVTLVTLAKTGANQ